jgi:hypothetical protein
MLRILAQRGRRKSSHDADIMEMTRQSVENQGILLMKGTQALMYFLDQGHGPLTLVPKSHERLSSQMSRINGYMSACVVQSWPFKS